MGFRWTIEQIGALIQQFESENDRLPSSHDFDSCPYLPSARTIQNSYGGIRKLRETLGYSVVDFTTGKTRGATVRRINARGKEDEMRVYDILKSKFGEIFVHREKEYAFRNRVDFYVYHVGGFFGVDVFFPNNQKGFVNVLNHKIKKYVKFD